MKKKLLFLCCIGLPFFLSLTPNESLPQISHKVENLETELSYLKQKIENQDNKIETLREEITALVKATRDMQNSSCLANSSKVEKIEKNFEKFVQDLKQFKTQSNELADAISEITKKISEQKETFGLQTKEIHEVESALKTLAKAMETTINISKAPVAEKETAPTKQNHVVKAGDSLGKIAKEYGTTATAIKELNGLKSDVIFTGQELKVHE
jgi:LysM repeat protein